MRFYYLARNYKNINVGGNKAKADIEETMRKIGGLNAGSKQSHYKNALFGFISTLYRVLSLPFNLPKENVFVLQYPFKKFYKTTCRLARIKKSTIVTIIHDLESLREEKSGVKKELRNLKYSDYLIVHNQSMKKWLSEQGYPNPMVCLELFDYLSEVQSVTTTPVTSTAYNVLYVGKLRFRKNRFLYEMEQYCNNWNFILYGDGFEPDKITNRQHFKHKGFIPSDELISTQTGHFGLVWDGDSINSCSGSYGNYLRFNNPHKTSLYLRCQLPVIIWSQAALAPFIKENNVGLCIDSLEQLDTILLNLSEKAYGQMKLNATEISKKLNNGYFLEKALIEVFQLKMNQQ